MNRYEIRSEVRRILRDSDFPKEGIDRAINSVIATLNQLGRYRFNERYHDITLVASQRNYTQTNFIAEDAVILQPNSSDEKELTKIVELSAAYERGWFVTPGDAPDYYLITGNEIWFEPIPNAVAAGKVVRVYGWYRVSLFNNDLTDCDLADNYCISVLAWGAAAEINPSLVITNDPRGKSINEIFQMNLRSMLVTERYESKTQYKIGRDIRWSAVGDIGKVQRVR